MKIFIIGITGGVGSKLARALQDRGDTVSGLVRRAEQREELRAAGIDAELGDLTAITAPELAELIGDVDAVLLTAGNEPGRGTIALGPGQIHEHLARQDGAKTVTALLQQPGTAQEILEADQRSTPIAADGRGEGPHTRSTANHHEPVIEETRS